MARTASKTEADRRPEASVAVPDAAAKEPPRARLMRVQRSAGNRAAATMVRRQPGVVVGAVDDRHEHEADSMARKVVEALSGTAPSIDHGSSSGPTAPGAVGPEGGDAGPEFERRLQSARAGGTQLELPVRRRMEQAFGADLSHVRLHSGSTSAELNDHVSAQAFTVGSDIFFRDGVPDASTPAGQTLLAHEVTHTLQQGGGAHRMVVRRWGKKKKPTTPTPPKKSPEQEKEDLFKAMQSKAKGPKPKNTSGKDLDDEIGATDDPFDTAEGVGEALTGPMGSVDIVTGQDSYSSSLKKATGGSVDRGSSGASDTDSNRMGVASSASGFVGMFFGIAKAVNTFKNAEDVGSKIGAVLEGIGSGLAGTSAMASMVDSSSKLTGKYGVDSDGAAKGVGESTKAAGALSGITDSFGAVKEAFFTVKGIVDLVKGANEMTDEEKFKGSMEVIRHALEAAKSSVSAAKTFLDLCGSGVSAAMVNSIPGLGIAIGCADLVVRSVDLIVGAIRAHDMRMKKQETKTGSLLGGKKGESSKKKAEEILKDTSIPDDDPKKKAAHEYLTAKGLQWVNQKRINRAILKMSVAMTKIAGDAATLGGASAPVGIGLKVGALALDVGASIFRRFKQWARDKVADAEDKKQAAATTQNPYQKGFLAKIFNTDKSTKKKMAEYNRMVTNVFVMIKAVDITSTPPDEKAMNRCADYVSAMGYSMKAMERDFKKDPSGAKVRENMIAALKKRE